MTTETAQEPGTASVEDGAVVLDGPGHVASTMTPDAAKATGASLQAAGDEASSGEAQAHPS